MVDTSDLIGRVFDSRYQITALVGRGGMGTVYKAVHVAMNQVVALKVLHREMSRDECQVQRFYQEARASSRLKHPNTIKVFDFGRSDEGHLYLAMEYLEGETLTQLMRREGALPVERALKIVRQVAKSLAEAHMNGLVHRDLKPDNVFITQIYGEKDFVKVLDFGIAKFLQAGVEYGPLTQAGLVCGTPLYLSPEQALGRTLDGRSDLYSLGVILFEMLSGLPPFRAETPVALVLKHVHDPPPPLGEGVGGIPESVRALVFSLLDKDRDRRPASAEALVGILDQILSTLPTSTRPADAARPVAPRPARTESVATRMEVLRPTEAGFEAGGEPSVSKGATPVPSPASPSGREGQATATCPAEEPGGRTVNRDEPTVLLSPVEACQEPEVSRSGSTIAEDEETVVVSLADSVQVLVAAPAPQERARISVRREGASGQDEPPTLVEPPSHIPRPVVRVRETPATSRRTGLWVLVVALVVVTAGAAGVGVATLIRGGGGPASEADLVVLPSPPPARSAADAVSVTVGGQEPEVAASPPPPPLEPARQVTLTIETAPTGALVFDGERKVGVTPFTLTVREGDAPVTLRFASEGFEDAFFTVDPNDVLLSGRTRHALALERKISEPQPPPPKKVQRRPQPPPRPATEPKPSLQWE